MKGFHLTIIQIGKTKNRSIEELEKEYIKRLKSYAEVKVLTLKDGGKGEKDRIKKEEGRNILKKVPENSFVVALHEKGKEYTSDEFAKFMGKKQDAGSTNITFIIGGCYGLDEEVLNRADIRLSFSSFTFTHELIRPLLYEQLYRCFTLIEGKKYHY